MKAIVYGCGRMGKVIAYAMNKLGFEVSGVDFKEEALSSLIQSCPEARPIIAPNLKYGLDFISNNKPDVVISSLPYHQTKDVGFFCIDIGVRYCDLGGRVDVSEQINKYAKENARAPVMTDLGLAPGLVNILAEHGCTQVHETPENVRMMVGGLPKKKINHPMNYAVTWSVDGLINEYDDDCEVLENGEIITVKGMSGHELIETKNLGTLEAFCTSGGASHTLNSMKKRGIPNCSYKTLRHKGHRDIVRFLIRNCKLGADCLKRVFDEGCRDVCGVGDLVVLKVIVEANEISYNKELLVLSDAVFSAMQKATAFPIAAVASMMAQGMVEGDKDQMRGYYTQYPNTLSYRDIPFHPLKSNLDLLGIKIK